MLHPYAGVQTPSERRSFLEIKNMSASSANASTTPHHPFVRFLHEVGHLIQAGYAVMPTYEEFVLHQTISWSIWVILCLLVWMTYYPQQPDFAEIFEEAAQVDPLDTFHYGHFGCLQNPKIFAW